MLRHQSAWPTLGGSCRSGEPDSAPWRTWSGSSTSTASQSAWTQRVRAASQHSVRAGDFGDDLVARPVAAMHARGMPGRPLPIDAELCSIPVLAFLQWFRTGGEAECVRGTCRPCRLFAPPPGPAGYHDR